MSSVLPTNSNSNFYGQRFVVLTTQRSGSVFLQQYLDSHPQVRCYGEILLGIGGLYKRSAPRFLDRHRRLRLAWTWVLSGGAFAPGRVIRQAMCQPSSLVVGFRVMYNQLRWSRQALRALVSIPNLHVIHLRRENALRQYISLKHMHRRAALIGKGSAHATKKIVLDKIRITPNRAIRYMEKIKQSGAQLHKEFQQAGKPIFPISYEALLSEERISDFHRNQLCDFLSVPVAEMSSPLVRMSVPKLDDQVSNMQELRQVLRGTEYESMAEI